MNAAASKLREWRERPGLFAREVLRVEEVDAWQEEVLDAATRERRIALKASKGPGKSTVLAWLIWWFLLTRPHPKVVATSISGDNLRDNLWSELSKWQKRSPLLSQAFVWSAERIASVEHPETWWASARQWSRSADPSQQADTLAGIHADSVMFVVDESGGVPDAVMAAAEAGLANADDAKGTEALLVQAGNPTHLAGPLYRACTQERALWWVKEISGDPDDPKRAPRVSIEWAREQISKYGRDNPWVLVNVFGKFPPGQADTLLGVEEVGEASRRSLHPHDFEEETKILGVDVARFGDDETCFMLRQGRAAFRPVVFRNLSTMQVAYEVASVLEKHQPDGCFIDVTGIGAGVVDRLLELNHRVTGVDFGSKAFSGKYLNRRVEMWWKMADWLKGGGAIPDDATLRSELPAPKYKFAQDGRLQLESKDDMKKRGVPSPNRADALALTFAAPVARRGLVLPGRPPQRARDFDPYAQKDFDPYA
jgi:phage terminase large subunit